MLRDSHASTFLQLAVWHRTIEKKKIFSAKLTNVPQSMGRSGLETRWIFVLKTPSSVGKRGYFVENACKTDTEKSNSLFYMFAQFLIAFQRLASKFA